MSGTPTLTYTSLEAYALFTTGATIRLEKGGGASVIVGDVAVSISDPEDIAAWLEVDCKFRAAHRLPHSNQWKFGQPKDAAVQAVLL